MESQTTRAHEVERAGNHRHRSYVAVPMRLTAFDVTVAKKVNGADWLSRGLL